MVVGGGGEEESRLKTKWLTKADQITIFNIKYICTINKYIITCVQDETGLLIS